MIQGSGEARGYITVTFVAHYDEETGQYSSRCEELGISSSGKDLDQAFDRIAEATCLYLSTLEEVHERERVFRERGITIAIGDPPPERELSVHIHPDEYASARNLPVPAGV